MVGLEVGRLGAFEIESSLEELMDLSRTAGALVVGQIVARLDKPHPAFFVGRGKATELAQACQDYQARMVIFDHDLSPVQLRNLQETCGVKILDRTQLILDIFSLRAHTKEAQLQVELAQLKYLLPRLTGQWLHLSRQEGGIGMRGPGETQLEVDRRRVKTRILKLSSDLKRVQSERQTQRKKRKKFSVPVVSIIGYTNAGKTTLFNRLTDSSNLAEDRLFATLDATVRKGRVGEHHCLLFADTVGFIRKLPHHLVESFKATLEEVLLSDLLIYVVDAHDAWIEEKYEVVLSVLNDLKAGDIPRVLVLNKVDLLPFVPRMDSWEKKEKKVVSLSAKTGVGLDKLTEFVDQFVREGLHHIQVLIPHELSEWVSLLYREGNVLQKKFLKEGVFLEMEVPESLLSKINRFQCSDLPPSEDNFS